MTPMQEQYQKIKVEYKDFIVLFRLGDFYEAFNDDAVTLSKVLGITLTGRGKDDKRTPMAGIPHHALATYMPKMVEASLKVVIADQVEEAVPGKLVERKVTKVVTPGTVMDENSLDASKNNFIACFYRYVDKKQTSYLLSYCDLTTGLLQVFSTQSLNQLKLELNKVNPSEILTAVKDYEFLKEIYSKSIEKVDDSKFDLGYASEILLGQLQVLSLKGFGIDDTDPLVITAGVLINFLQEYQRSELKHIKTIRKYQYSDYMQLDFETIRNLELVYSANGNDRNTLYGVLNQAATAMGKRKLRNWIIYPLINPDILQDRLDSVETFYSNPILASDVDSNLSNIADIERIMGRIGVQSANPRDLIALKNSLLNIQQLISQIKTTTKLSKRLNTFIEKLAAGDSDLLAVVNKVVDIVNKSIADEPPASISNTGIIKEGFNSEIDEIRSLRQNSKQVLANLQSQEIEKTGINTLKISFNQVFGYYIEITKTHLNKVPDYYIRKQTLANAERYIIPELKELEEKILSAEEKLIKLEQNVFFEVRNKITECIAEILEVAEIISEIDCYINFAKVARENQYTKPTIKSDDILLIEDSRHPVIEKIISDFTPNSIEFNSDYIHILTGPNMSGKSTYIRQIALITLMAQIGSFVPAKKMEWKLIDRIFTRVGATDNLSKGESTFMVEMNETANILNNATKDSLIILDEVGRGTSTYDGVAIAWSIIEFIYKQIKAKTLFATHYHELIDLEKQYKEIANYNVEVLEDKGEIMFKHKIVKGGTNQSYGVHVAKLAGIPKEVLTRANEILEAFELDNKVEKTVKKNSKASPSKSITKPKAIHPDQLGLI